MTRPFTPPGGDVKSQLSRRAAELGARIKAMTPATKIAAVVGTLVVTLGGYVFLTWVSAPTYAPLFNNLAPADASAIVDQLNTAGIPYQLGANGTEVLVPQAQVYTERLALSGQGLPKSSDTGYSLLDNEGVTTSEFKQRVDYQRALEGELASTIGSINGVQKADVHLAIPQQDVFNDGTQKTTASVLLTLGRGSALTGQQVDAVVNLVASAVPNLTTDQVTVTDSTGRVLAAGGATTTGGAGAGGRDDAVAAFEQRTSTRVQAMLDKLVGSGHAVVTVTADLNYDKTNTTSRTYTYNPNTPPVAVSTSSEKYTGSGAASAGGVAGAATPAATPTPATASGSGNGSYTKDSGTQNNAVGTTDTVTETAPGAVRKLNVAVVTDSGVAAPVSSTALSSLVSSAVGLDPTRGDTISVQAMPFSAAGTTSGTSSTAATAAAAAAAATRKLEMVAALAGVLLLAMVVFVVLLLRRRKRRAPEPEPYEPAPVEVEPVPEPSPVPASIIPTKPPLEANLEANRKQLHEMASDSPTDVARVLRSWLND